MKAVMVFAAALALAVLAPTRARAQDLAMSWNPGSYGITSLGGGMIEVSGTLTNYSAVPYHGSQGRWLLLYAGPNPYNLSLVAWGWIWFDVQPGQTVNTWFDIPARPGRQVYLMVISYSKTDPNASNDGVWAGIYPP